MTRRLDSAVCCVGRVALLLLVACLAGCGGAARDPGRPPYREEVARSSDAGPTWHGGPRTPWRRQQPNTWGAQYVHWSGSGFFGEMEDAAGVSVTTSMCWPVMAVIAPLAVLAAAPEPSTVKWLAGAGIVAGPPLLLGLGTPGRYESEVNWGLTVTENVEVFAEASLQYSAGRTADEHVAECWRWLLGLRFQHWPPARGWGAYTKAGLMVVELELADEEFVPVGPYVGAGVNWLVRRSERTQVLLYTEGAWAFLWDEGESGRCLLGEFGFEVRW